MARIHHQHQAGENLTWDKREGDKLLPVAPHLERHLRIAISRQIREKRAGFQTKKVDVLRAPRRLADECKPGMIRQRVDRGRLSSVGSSRKGDSGRPPRRQLRPVCGGSQKFGMMKRVRARRARAWLRAGYIRYNMLFASLAVL